MFLIFLVMVDIGKCKLYNTSFLLINEHVLKTVNTLLCYIEMLVLLLSPNKLVVFA